MSSMFDATTLTFWLADSPKKHGRPRPRTRFALKHLNSYRYDLKCETPCQWSTFPVAIKYSPASSSHIQLCEAPKGPNCRGGKGWGTTPIRLRALVNESARAMASRCDNAQSVTTHLRPLTKTRRARFRRPPKTTSLGIYRSLTCFRPVTRLHTYPLIQRHSETLLFLF